MTNCSDWLDELTHPAEIVLEEDLAALERMSDEIRVERYEEIKANEDELLWDFSKECADFLTDAERDHIRSKLRLARLLLAASFYDDGELPEEVTDDFIDAELRAVVEFDRYKQFDVLDEDQIEERIRRMDGEVYELATEYTSTQIANMDELIDDPDVQQDVIERLVDRYDERREKIRQGFFVYIETHGIEHMVEAIEDAVTAVSDAADERERVHEELRETAGSPGALDASFRERRRAVESEFQALEQQLASGSPSRSEFAEGVQRVREHREKLSDAEEDAIEMLTERIDRASELEGRLKEKIDELETVKRETANADRAAAREDAAALVENELETLESDRTSLETEMERLEAEQDRIVESSARIDERREEFESRLEAFEAAVDETSETGLESEHLVTATIARLLELDYLGRFDTAMHEADEIHTPNRKFSVPNDYWASRSSRSSERPRVSEQLLDGDDPDQYPTNQAARYEITDSSYFGLASQTEMVIEALVYAHLDAYTSNGFDTQPADLDDLLSLVNDTIREAEDSEHAHLLAVASPTGWSDRVRQQVANSDVARTHYSRQVSLCLVDLQSGDLIYDDSDPMLSENVALFEPRLDAERTSSCVDTVREHYVADAACESVLLQELIDEHGFDSHVAKRAFNELEDDGVGEQLFVEDVGLALYLD